MSETTLSTIEARRFHRVAVGLSGRCPHWSDAMRWHGYIQLDPIQVCGRMHDLILRNRVDCYREGQLSEELHAGERRGFEHYLPGTTAVLVAYPFEAWPFVLACLSGHGPIGQPLPQAAGKAQRLLAERILGEIRERGPLTSDEIEHPGRSQTVWGTMGREVKVVLESLFREGRVLITRRAGFRRVYDLPERVVPDRIRTLRSLDRVEAVRFRALLKLRQRRLVALSRVELAAVEDLVAPLKVEGLGRWYVLRTDLEALEDARRATTPVEAEPRLLAPLDPLIYDRKLTAALWGFSYTWEVYVPPAKRARGYYALPVLSGLDLVGHVDPKADRAAGRLRVVGRSLRRGYSTQQPVRELARFLGLVVR